MTAAVQHLATDRPAGLRHHPHDRAAEHSDRVVSLAHQVRGAHTLCGRPARFLRWRQPSVSDTPCPNCAQVPPHLFTHHDLLEAAGFTYRQLDFWCRRGWLWPENPAAGSGTRRLFAATEVQVARVMGRLVNAGITPEAAATVARGGELAPGISIDLPDQPSLAQRWTTGRGECT